MPVARKKKQKHSADSSPMENYEQTMSAGLSDLKDILAYRKQTMRGTAKWRVMIVFACISGLLCMGLLLKNSSDFTAVTKNVASQMKTMNEDKPGKQEAMRAVYEWVGEGKGAFPQGATNYSWDGAKKVRSTTDSESKVTTEYWSHTISFISKSDVTTRTVVQLVTVKDGVATASGDPTILPMDVTQSDTGSSTTPTGYMTFSQPDSLSNAIAAWAKAYVGKDSNALTVLVGDPNSKHAYMPAKVGTYQSSTINWAVSTKKVDAKSSSKRDDNPEYGAVSVSVTFTPYGVAKDSSQTVTTDITLLVKEPAKGSARIVDWGADASIDTLKAYANAVSSTLISGDGDDKTDTDDDGKTPSGQSNTSKTDSDKTEE